MQFHGIEASGDEAPSVGEAGGGVDWHAEELADRAAAMDLEGGNAAVSAIPGSFPPLNAEERSEIAAAAASVEQTIACATARWLGVAPADAVRSRQVEVAEAAAGGVTIDSPGDTPPPLVEPLDMDTDPERTAAAALAAARLSWTPTDWYCNENFAIIFI